MRLLIPAGRRFVHRIPRFADKTFSLAVLCTKVLSGTQGNENSLGVAAGSDNMRPSMWTDMT
jgi:hypothetical protein